ncbi:MAG: hypothetical protein IPH57_04480 [Saprospiraceae bacterium]|nr:hypothetical protein [Saprospiraceae bacterium]
MVSISGAGGKRGLSRIGGTPLWRGRNPSGVKVRRITTVIAFITAWIAVKIFLKIVENYGFKHFGYYRILIGIIFLLIMR